MNYSRIIISLVLCYLLNSCNLVDNKNIKINQTPLLNKSNQDETKRKKASFLKYDDYIVIKDTLKINSDDDFLDYPFGYFQKISELKKRLKNFQYTQECYEDKNQTKLERFYDNKNYIKFYLVERFYDNKIGYEIVSANINDGNVKLNNGVYIGMSKAQFFSTISSLEKVKTSDINVVMLSWDVLGIYHYYNFKDDTLLSIIIDTDFKVNKI